MRIALFTNQFPARVSTFFAREVRSLIEAGISVDVFPIYPHDPSLWKWVPEILDERVLPRRKVHHAHPAGCALAFRPWPVRRVAAYLADCAAILASASRYGLPPLAKSLYVMPLAWAWAQKFGAQYDHILSFWGNYAATCAWLANRLLEKRLPFSFSCMQGRISTGTKCCSRGSCSTRTMCL